MSVPPSSVAVVHLVRYGNPDEYLKKFLASYQKYAAGIPHELVILLKGYEQGQETPAILRDLSHTELRISDTGFDINAYRCVAAEIEHEFVCFLNSHTCLEAPDWLKHLAAPFETRLDCGVVGATGNWECLTDNQTFPNIHIRTNGFLMRRRDFLDLKFGPLASKRDCNRFEAGPDSLTAQVLGRGRLALVAGHQGMLFEPEAWPESQTFRSGNQEALLISDNRTRKYQRAMYGGRRRLARLSWGERAMPARKRLRDWLA